MHVRAELDEGIGQVRAHEAVRAGDEDRAAAVDVAEVALERVEVGSGSRSSRSSAATRVSGRVESEPCNRSSRYSSTLERLAGLARRLGLGPVVDRVAPIVARPFERFVLDVDGVRLAGTNLAQLHYVRELHELGRERTFVRLLAEAIPSDGVVLEGGAHLGFVTVHEARAAGPGGRVIVFEPNARVLLCSART